VKLCFSGKYTEKEVLAMIAGGGGLVSLAGTNQAREVAQRAAEGDAEADLAIRAMIYSIAKQIGQLATVLYGKVDAVILTGGIAHNTRVVTELKERCSFIAPVVIYPGENELESLVQNALRVLHGEENAKDY
jgi:butyrate kinase